MKVVKALALLLRQFESNTIEVNHYVTKMLHRIAWTCKMPGMIFQASIFRVFQRILESKDPVHKVTRKRGRPRGRAYRASRANNSRENLLIYKSRVFRTFAKFDNMTFVYSMTSDVVASNRRFFLTVGSLLFARNVTHGWILISVIITP